MRSRTHELVTRAALSAIEPESALRVPSWFGAVVVGAAVELDRRPEYEGKRRVAHHTCGAGRVLSKLGRARRDVLKGGITREGAEELGKALHYIQDRCVPSPKLDRELHERVEREAALARVAPLATLRSAPRPVGRGELRRLLERQRPARDGASALACAAFFTFAALYAVLANPRRAPDAFVEAAEAARRSLSGVARWVCVAASLIGVLSYAAYGVLALYALDETLLHAFAFALLLPCALTCLCALAAFCSRSLQGFLRNLARASNLRALTPSVLALFSAPPPLFQPLALAVFASAFAAGATPYLSRDFRTVREEAFWFEWE